MYHHSHYRVDHHQKPDLGIQIIIRSLKSFGFMSDVSEACNVGRFCCIKGSIWRKSKNFLRQYGII